jgi:hypothetical protein
MDVLTVEKLAEILQEPKAPLLRQVLRTFGPERTVAVLTDTLQCEAQGGMRTKDGSRRRTPGGVFFQLVKARATPQERRRLFPPAGPQRPQAPARPHAAPHAPTWGEVQAVVPTLSQGEATVKLTLIGRPGQVETHGPAVVFRMQGKPPASLPRGLPPLPSTPALTWTVIVALRQWNRVKDSLTTNEDDQLILEGYPVMEGTQPVLLVQSCASMRQQREKKQAQHPPQAETTR